MDPILCSFDEFVDHLNKHCQDVHGDVILNDKLYSEQDYPQLKALLVDTGSSCWLIFS